MKKFNTALFSTMLIIVGVLLVGCPGPGPGPGEGEGETGEGEGEGEDPFLATLTARFPLAVSNVLLDDVPQDCGGANEHSWEFTEPQGNVTVKPAPTDQNHACVTQDFSIEDPGTYNGDWSYDGACALNPSGSYSDNDGSVIAVTTEDGFDEDAGRPLRILYFPMDTNEAVVLHNNQFAQEVDDGSGGIAFVSGTISDDLCTINYHAEGPNVFEGRPNPLVFTSNLCD